MKTHTMQVNIINLMEEAARLTKTFPITAGFNVARGCLARIATRACELKDKQLITELETLMLVERGKDERAEGSD